jgi:hypothetical protein
LDFPQIVDLADRGKLAFQAFHGVKGPITGMLHPENVAEGAFACLAFYHVFAHPGPGEGFGGSRYMNKVTDVLDALG